MRLSTTRRAWQSWQAAAGPWQGWSVCPALLAPETDGDVLLIAAGLIYFAITKYGYHLIKHWPFLIR